MGRTRARFKYRKQQRFREAEERQLDREQRSPKDQLTVLDNRLGEGVGAKKERTKLQSQISDSS